MLSDNWGLIVMVGSAFGLAGVIGSLISDARNAARVRDREAAKFAYPGGNSCSPTLRSDMDTISTFGPQTNIQMVELVDGTCIGVTVQRRSKPTSAQTTGMWDCVQVAGFCPSGGDIPAKITELLVRAKMEAAR